MELYEKFLGIKVGDRCRSGNKFVEFYFDNECLSLMNESNLGLVLPEIGKTILSASLLDGTAISFEQKTALAFQFLIILLLRENRYGNQADAFGAVILPFPYIRTTVKSEILPLIRLIEKVRQPPRSVNVFRYLLSHKR